MLSEHVTINDSRDTLTVYGVEMTGDLLRAFELATPPGQWFRIVKRVDGVSTIETKYEPPIA